jgi:hypothetical protein
LYEELDQIDPATYLPYLADAAYLQSVLLLSMGQDKAGYQWSKRARALYEELDRRRP